MSPEITVRLRKKAHCL